MAPRKRDAKQRTKTSLRRRLTARERLEHARRQAQHAAQVLEQALHDLGLFGNLVVEIEGRLRSQKKLLGKMVGVMCPPLFGCRTNTELCRVRGWDKNLPSRLLGALTKRSWLKRLRRLGVEVLVPLWRYAASRSEATRSCSGLRTGPLGLANTGVGGPTINAKTRPRRPTLSANEPTLVCEGLAHMSAGQHALRTG
jgi:hypothetical protein